MKWIFIGTLLFSMDAMAENKAVINLKAHLKAESASWQASENWVTDLSRDEAIRLMGARDVDPQEVDFSIPVRMSTAPKVIDWRDRDGKNYVSPILNQGNCGSCVAFAAVATLETQMNITSAIPLLNPKYSTQALFACGGGLCDRGWYTGVGARAVVNQGVPDEACAPYTMGATGQDVACNTVCGDKADRTQKAMSAKNLLNSEEVKAGLAKGPVMASMYVYEDFTAYSSGIYKHSKGEGLGGHAISIIGFDDTKRAWIIRNSWGPDWGIKGFGYVSYDDVSGIGSKGIQFEVAKEDDYLWTDLKDRSFISGQKDLVVKTNGKATDAWTVSVLNNRQTRVADTACTEASCTLSLNTTELPDGEYELTARQGEANLHRYFYISNESGHYKIKMTPLFDAKTAVKGRIEFDLKLTQYSKVPLTRIAFVYENAKGVVKERWTDSVADDMVQGWRTNMTTNGRYKVWYRGEQVVGGRALTFDSAKVAIDVQN